MIFACQSRSTGGKLTVVTTERHLSFMSLSLAHDKKNVSSLYFINVSRSSPSPRSIILCLTVMSQLKLMGFDTSPHARGKEFVLKYSIKIKYRKNIDYNQPDFHNIIADITVINVKNANSVHICRR